MTLAAMACQANMPDSADDGQLLNFVDWVIRACRNPKISAHYFRLLVSLVDTYPQLLEVVEKEFEIEVKLVRKNAADVSEKTAERFFKDLSTINVVAYKSPFDKAAGQRRSYLTPLPDFTYVETFDTSSVDRKRKAKAEEEKRRNQFRDPRKLWNCEVCGGELLYDATAHCKSCGHVHATIKDIPAADITIEAEVHEIADGEEDAWLNEWDTPTVEVQAISPAVQQLPMTPAPAAPASVGKHPRGIACPDCHAMNNWRAVPADWGGEIYVCAICYPD